jgi:hypothetical protein
VRRRRTLILISAAVIVFLAVSALLARIWSADGAETDAVTALIQAEARGDQTAMINRIQGCSASTACRARVSTDATALRQPGSVEILRLDPSTGFSFGGTLGTARIAWKSPSSTPIVQCVRVRRSGNALKGLTIELLEISARIKNDAACPARF